MRLNDPLITYFEFEGKKYNIDLSFDNVLDVFDVLNDKELRDYERVNICLELLIDEKIEDNIIDLWGYIYKEFIEIKHKQPIEYDLQGNPMPTQEDEDIDKFIDLEQDAEHIYASFMQAYNINLFEEHRNMHWHEFRALLNGLPGETILQRIIRIRTWKPSKGDSTEYKENMRKLQKIYTLNDLEKLE